MRVLFADARQGAARKIAHRPGSCRTFPDASAAEAGAVPTAVRVSSFLPSAPPVTARPAAADYAPSYARYVDLVPEAPLLDTLREQPEALERLVGGDNPGAAYAPGKWTVRQVVQHVADTERVFAFRALWFARGAEAPLPSFDENAWADATDPQQPLEAALAEFGAVRAATLALLGGLPGEAWDRAGMASGHRMTALAAVFVVAGHAAHHAAILRERYGLGEG